MELINCSIKIQNSSIHGWGVFSTEFIPKDKIIIQSPGVILSNIALADPSITYYAYPCEDKIILGLGYPSFINSSDNPNVSYDIDKKNKIITLKTTRDIQPNEEITFKYL